MFGRRYNPWIRTLAGFALTVLTVAACGISSCPGNEMRRATDQVGRTVVFPAEPVRVIAMAPSITEIIFAIGREDRLAGVTQYSDFPEPARALPRIGSYIQLDLERIVALKPDLCIAVKDGNPKGTVDRMVSLGIPVFAVNPVDLASVMEAIGQIGMLLNAGEKAGAVVADMHRRIERVDRLVATAPDRPGVFFQIGISPIVSAGSGTFINELIQRAGGRNLAQGQPSYPRFSREQVLVMDPDIIIITSMARAEAFEAVKRGWESWPRISAVKHGRVHVVDSDILDRPTPRMADGLELLAGLIHPELFGQ
ncbi:MAG: cobalamin-binding protein [Pseudomonadota bacterium]